MSDLSASFDEAWRRFRAADSLRLVEDTTEAEWARGRAQFLTFLVRIDAPAAQAHVASVSERLAGIPGVDVYPNWYWHVTVKMAGFQVIKRTYDDDVLRQDVPRIAGRARAALRDAPSFEAQLGLANSFPGAAVLEVWDDGAFAQLNARLTDGVDGITRYESDGERFLPHLSVARFTSADALDELKETLSALRDEGPGPSFSVRRVEFVKAWLSEDVPEFDVLATYALAGRR